MSEPAWSAPAGRVDVETARRGILWQHERIRAMLEKARSLADAVLDGNAPSRDAVASSIGEVRSTIDVHFVFEETVLLPLLREDPSMGPERTGHLLDEHRRQREMLASLHQEGCAHPELPMLAAKLAFLTSWLLADMCEEERSL
jgi:iron-sulfur cluster repair protein YtfE (RIC family)